MFARSLNVAELTQQKSLFLLGPRQTGKSTLLRLMLPQALYIDLLSPPLFRELAAHPEHLEDMVRGNTDLVVIDEIQSLPDLLGVVHRLIEHERKRFVLTGSSARKLRKGGANLLGGRARMCNLLPITTHELAQSKASENWLTLLERGGIPSILTSASPQEDLDSYVGLYLKEEVQAEAIVRSLPSFSRFLTVAGSSNGHQINFERFASDVGVSAKILRSYMQVLVDTLVADMLLPFQRSQKRKVVSAPKFYFFDIGVSNALRGVGKVPRGSENFGANLEHLVFLELKALRSYSRDNFELTYWRTTAHYEVDFVVSQGKSLVAIEVKGTAHPDATDCKGLRAFAEEFPSARRILVCDCAVRKQLADGIEVLPAALFFDEIWSGRMFP